MRVEVAADVAALPRVHADHRNPLWWGILGLIVIEAAVVATFIASYLYLLAGEAAPANAGAASPPRLLETVNVGLLVASAGAMWWAGARLRAGSQRGLVVGLIAALLLDAIVLVLRWLQFLDFDFSWSDHAHGSMVWTLTGFHFVHVASAILGTLVVAVLAARGYFDRERQLAVVIDTMYWYFVSFAWIPLYLILYWSSWFR